MYNCLSSFPRSYSTNSHFLYFYFLTLVSFPTLSYCILRSTNISFTQVPLFQSFLLFHFFFPFFLLFLSNATLSWMASPSRSFKPVYFVFFLFFYLFFSWCWAKSVCFCSLPCSIYYFYSLSIYLSTPLFSLSSPISVPFFLNLTFSSFISLPL